MSSLISPLYADPVPPPLWSIDYVLLLPDVLFVKDEDEIFDEFLSFYILWSKLSNNSSRDVLCLELVSVSNNKFLPYFYFFTNE
jgi:hypothetical protein